MIQLTSTWHTDDNYVHPCKSFFNYMVLQSTEMPHEGLKVVRIDSTNIWLGRTSPKILLRMKEQLSSSIRKQQKPARNLPHTTSRIICLRL